MRHALLYRRGNTWRDSESIGCGGLGGNFDMADGDGLALVIHANADDHTTQPIGGAGDRIACAVLSCAWYRGCAKYSGAWCWQAKCPSQGAAGVEV